MMLKSKKNLRILLKVKVLFAVFCIQICLVSCVNEPTATDNQTIKQEVVTRTDTVIISDTVYKTAPVVNFSIPKSNVLYVGVSTPVEINVPGVKEDRISVSVINGTIQKRAGNLYDIRIKHLDKKVHLIVSVDGEKVMQKEFRTKKVPDPKAVVAGKPSGDISKNVLLNTKGIQAVLEGFDFDFRFMVISFTVSATINGNEVVVKQQNGARFSPEQMDLIKRIPPGGKIYIDEIKARGADGTTRKLGAISIKVK